MTISASEASRLMKSNVITSYEFTIEEVIGHITLRKPPSENSEWRLGFVIVDDAKRGLGLGQKLVDMATDYAHKELDATKVSLGVFENNPSAIHCYEAAGFKQVHKEKTESYTCFGETWNCIEMEFNGHP